MFFSTKPKIIPKIVYDSKGEKVILEWQGLNRRLKIFSTLSIGYLYFLYQFERDTIIGSVTKYSVPMFGITFGLIFRKLARLVHRIILLEGGNVIKIEKYPFTGWGHYNKTLLNITSIEGLMPYGQKRWYNPFCIGKGFYKLGFKSVGFLGMRKKDHFILKLSDISDKDILKIIIVGKTVNEQSLRMIINSKNS